MTDAAHLERQKAFLRNVFEQVKFGELLCQKDGLKKLSHMRLAAAVVAGLIKPNIAVWASDADTTRVLDAVEAFKPEHPIALEWRAFKLRGMKLPKRGRGRSSVAGRNLIAIHLVSYLSANGLANATRNHHDASLLRNQAPSSACDTVAEILDEICSEPVCYHAIRNAWEQRKELLGTK